MPNLLRRLEVQPDLGAAGLRLRVTTVFRVLRLNLITPPKSICRTDSDCVSTPSIKPFLIVRSSEQTVTGRENYRLHSQIVFPVSTYDRGEGHIAKMKHFERPSGGLRVYLPKASAQKLHQ